MKPILFSSKIEADFMSVSPFNELKAEEISAILKQYDIRFLKAKRGDVIFHQGDVCQKLYILLDGKLKIEKIDSKGNSLLMGYMYDPSVFAVYPLFSCDGKFLSTITSVGESVIATLGKETILQILEDYPEMLHGFISVTGECMRCHRERLSILSKKTIRERVAAYIIMCRIEDGVSKVIHSQTQLADYIGVSRPALSTEINKMKKDGTIVYERGGVIHYKPELNDYL